MTVSDKLRAIGEEPRVGSRKLLRSLGKIKREHRTSPLYYMVAAEDRRRERQETGQPLSRTDQKWISQMNEVIFTPRMVVGYDRELGFYLQPRTDDDDDFIRIPKPDTELTSLTGKRARPSRTRGRALAFVLACNRLVCHLFQIFFRVDGQPCPADAE